MDILDLRNIVVEVMRLNRVKQGKTLRGVIPAIDKWADELIREFVKDGRLDDFLQLDYNDAKSKIVELLNE